MSKGSKKNRNSKSFKSKKYKHSPATSPVGRPTPRPTLDIGKVSSSPTGAQTTCTARGRQQCKRVKCEGLPDHFSPDSPIGQCLAINSNADKFCSECLGCDIDGVGDC